MMADDSDEEDYIFYGTKIEDELEAKQQAFKPKVLELGKTRTAPVALQEPTDEQGRKRFHGAFTGGFSAGYFNTVGSKEGFQPATFKSSRSDRASLKSQSVEDYMDEDEKQERGKTTLQVKADFDTFGAAAAELARGISQREAALRPSLIPGAALGDLLAPTTTSLGVQLLQKMGWRAGRGVVSAPVGPGPGQDGAAAGRRSKWGTVAGVSLDNTPLYVLEPKQDVHGLGFDPFEGADDFRHLKQQRTQAQQAELQRAAAAATSKLGMGGGGGPSGAAAVGSKRVRGVAFGGYTEDSGMYGYMEDYVDEEEGLRPSKQGVLLGKEVRDFNYEMDDSGSEEEGARPGKRRQPLLLEAGEGPAPLMLQTAEQLRKGGDFILGFKKSAEQVVITLYPPPQVPDDWRPIHVFPPSAAEPDKRQEALPPPPDVPPPQDPELKKQIDSLAAMVARSGPAVEVLARKQASAAAQQQGERTAAGEVPPVPYQFLIGGEGALYYTWRLHKIKAALAAASKTATAVNGQAADAGVNLKSNAGRTAGLSVAQRMELLGEEALPSTVEAAKALAEAQGLAGVPPGQAPPAPAQVAPGDRQRLQAALGSMFVKGDTQDMSSEQSQAVGLRRPTGKDAAQEPAAPPTVAAVLAGFGDKFRSAGKGEGAGLEARAAGLLQPTKGSVGQANSNATTAVSQEQQKPKRWFEDWRPEPLVCKRFNVPDPYKGKPLAPQQSKFKTDYLALPETTLGLAGQGEAGPSTTTAAAAGAAAQGVPLALPPPPPLPIDMASAVARAAAIAQQLTQQQQQQQGTAQAPMLQQQPASRPSSQAAEVQQPLDAKSYAANFLSSLAGGALLFGAEAAGVIDTPTQRMPAAQEGQQGGVESSSVQQPDQAEVPPGDAPAQAGSAEGPTSDFPSLDRPMDIFKAIFEADDDREGEDEAEEAKQKEQQAQGPQEAAMDVDAGGEAGPQHETPLGVDGGAGKRPAGTTQQQFGLASALMKAQEVAAQRATQQGQLGAPAGPAAAVATQQPGLAQPAGVTSQPPAGGLAVDPEVQQRILAALNRMKDKDRKGKKKEKEKKKRSKDKKDKQQRSSKGKSGKERSSKGKHKSSSSKARHTSKRGRGSSKPASDSGSESGELDSGGSESSDASAD